MPFQWHAILDTISKPLRTFISLIHRAYKAGFHRDIVHLAINRGLREPISKEEFDSVWETVEKAQTMWDRIKYVRRDRAITERLMQPFRTPFDGKYAYVVRVKARNIWTGEETEQEITLRSWERLKRGEIEEIGAVYFYRYPFYSPDEWEVEESRIIEAWYNRYW